MSRDNAQVQFNGVTKQQLDWIDRRKIILGEEAKEDEARRQENNKSIEKDNEVKKESLLDDYADTSLEHS